MAAIRGQKRRSTQKKSSQAHVCMDSSDDDLPLKEIAENIRGNEEKRSILEKKSASDNCIVCGEFGPGGEIWFRCVNCGFWAHKDCTSAERAEGFICDICIN